LQGSRLRLTRLTDRQKHHATESATTGLNYNCSAMQPNNKSYKIAMKDGTNQ